MVEYDGSNDGLFSMRRRNKHKQWLVYTRGLLDKLISFVISARSTYTAATRHLVADVRSLALRRQDMVKLGTAFNATVLVTTETARCPKCGPNPDFIVIDAQSIGCTDVEDVQPIRPGEDCPVLPIEASKLCILQHAGLRMAVDKVLSGCKPLTDPQERLLAAWHATALSCRRPSVEAAAAVVFFRFFPLGSSSPATAAGNKLSKSAGGTSGAPKQGVAVSDDNAGDSEHEEGEKATKKHAHTKKGLGPEAAVRQDDDGNLVLGGKGKAPVPAVETWRDRVGVCAPNFSSYSRDDDGAWLCILPFLKAMLAETATSMFQSHDEAAVGLLADSLMFQGRGRWRDVTKAADGVGFVGSFLGLFDEVLDSTALFRVSVGVLLRQALDVETIVDEEFDKHANSKRTMERGWRNAQYCAAWGKRPTPADFSAWKAAHPVYQDADIDDPLVSFEFFASLPRVRPGIHDSVAAARRKKYHGKKRHAADVEGDGDACNKAFSIAAGLTQGVFNVVCPHVITLGFRCLFRAESVGEALSIVLERFPKLPRVIFYDVACKIDKNAMRRVRTIIRDHNVRCILDRPHSITHGCSPIYMPDESLGTTAGVATQAAEVSHSISVGNRTSLAYMAPGTYMIHRMIQVAFMNARKLYRLFSKNVRSENDHIALSPFFHQRLSHQCQRSSDCSCSSHCLGSGEESIGAVLSGSIVKAKLGSVIGAAASAAGSAALTSCGIPVGLQRGAMMSASDAAAARAVAALAAPPSPQPDGGVASDDGFDDDGPDSDWAPPDEDPASSTGAEEEDVPSAFNPSLFKDVDGPGTHPLSAELRLAVHRLSMDGFGDGPVRPLNRARIILSTADFGLLRGENWLNDEVMNSYLALINKRDGTLRQIQVSAGCDGQPPLPKFRRTCCFNTFLFNRIYSPLLGYDGDGVRKWGVKGGLDLQDVDLIVVPINLQRVHWVLVAIDVEHKTFLYFDPFGTGDNNGCLPIVRRWLREEAVRQLGVDGAAALDVHSWGTVVGDAAWPVQEDAGSCGVFSLLFANCLSAGLPPHFSQRDVPAVRDRMAVDLYLDELKCSTPATTMPL